MAVHHVCGRPGDRVEGALIASKHIEKMAARLEGPELVSLANYSLGANDEMVERLVKVLPTVAAELGALGKVEELASMLRLHDSPSNERANAAIIRELVALGPDVTKHVMDEARDGNDTTKLHAIDVMQGLGDDERASELEDLLSSGPLLRDIVVEPVVDERTGDLMLRTVREADFALPAVALEHMQRYAPLVAQRILESTGRTWGWPTTRLAEIDPEAVILHAVKCYHGESHEGWLVGTLDQLWWLEKGIFGSAEQPLSYTWGVEVRKRSRLTSTSPVGIQARRGLLAIGGGLFQMHARQLDDFGLFLRQMQLALGRLGDSDPLSESVVAEAAVAQPVSPTSLLKELAELRDLGVVTEDEFQAKKTEILSKQW